MLNIDQRTALLRKIASAALTGWVGYHAIERAPPGRRPARSAYLPGPNAGEYLPACGVIKVASSCRFATATLAWTGASRVEPAQRSMRPAVTASVATSASRSRFEQLSRPTCPDRRRHAPPAPNWPRSPFEGARPTPAQFGTPTSHFADASAASASPYCRRRNCQP